MAIKCYRLRRSENSIDKTCSIHNERTAKILELREMDVIKNVVNMNNEKILIDGKEFQTNWPTHLNIKSI